MRVVVPPGQRLPRVSASVSISRAEASELRDALDMVLGEGRSNWSVSVSWAEVKANVTLTLEMDLPRIALDADTWPGRPTSTPGASRESAN
jgi:hypothetical protein